MTTYAAYKTGATNIKHGDEHGKPLVLGWLVTNVEAGTERRYALRSDGNIACTEWRPVHESWFNQPGLAWFMRADIPDDAEFIGNYRDTGIDWE